MNVTSRPTEPADVISRDAAIHAAGQSVWVTVWSTEDTAGIGKVFPSKRHALTYVAQRMSEYGTASERMWDVFEMPMFRTAAAALKAESEAV